MAVAVAGFCAGADWPYAVNEIAAAINEVVNVNLKKFSAFPIVRFYRDAVSMSHTHVHMRRSGLDNGVRGDYSREKSD